MNPTELKASVDALVATTTEAISTTKTALAQSTARLDALEAINRRPGTGGGHDNDNGNGGDAKAYRSALAQFVRTGDETKLREISASMDSQSGPDGGYLVQPTYSTSWAKKLANISPLREIANVVQITSGNDFIEPVDANDVEATWVSEKASRPETDSAEIGMLTIRAHEIYALIPVTQTLVDDAGFDLGRWVEAKQAEQFARAESVSYVSGNGVGKPRGFLTYDVSTADDSTRAWGTVQTVSSGAAAAITADGLRNLVWSMRAPYRAGAGWLMSSETASKLDLLKDGEGRTLWRPSMAAGVPDALLGYPVYYSEDMPSVEASSLSIAFANWPLAFYIADRLGTRYMRDPFSSKPYILHYAFKRTGSGVANSQAIKLMKTEVGS